MSKVAFFDIDGVVADTGQAMIKIVQTELNKPWVRIEDISEYDITKLSWLSKTEVEELLVKFNQPAFYYYIPPMPDAPQFTHLLHKQGWQIIFVTARPAHLHDVTLYWLRKHNFYFDKLILSAPFEKINHCLNDSKCFLVEDRPDVLLQVAQSLPKMKLFIYDQPWNRHVKVGVRIKGLKEIIEIMGLSTRQIQNL